jgi:hypothetical protein
LPQRGHRFGTGSVAGAALIRRRIRHRSGAAPVPAAPAAAARGHRIGFGAGSVTGAALTLRRRGQRIGFGLVAGAALIAGGAAGASSQKRHAGSSSAAAVRGHHFSQSSISFFNQGNG